MKYLVCKKQAGYGCDYTIGCGMRFDFIECDSIQAAIESVIFPDGRDEKSALEGDNALVQILVVPAEYIISVDVSKAASEIEQHRKHESATAQEESELALLNHLRAKYNH